jgi:GNAT superfamily N-acetyltransferase
MRIRTREAEVADAEAMIHVHYRAVRAIPREFYSAECLASWSPRPDQNRYDWIRNAIRSEDRVVRVAQAGDALCGFAICTPVSGFINAIYTDPQHALRGVGRVLLRDVEDAHRLAGALVATVLASHNAMGFYEVAGYRFEASVVQELADGSALGCSRMVKVLSSV